MIFNATDMRIIVGYKEKWGVSDKERNVYDALFTKIMFGVDTDADYILPSGMKIGKIKNIIEDDEGYNFYNITWIDGSESLEMIQPHVYAPCLDIELVKEIVNKKYSIGDLAQKHYVWVDAMGWHGKATPLESLALVASEVGEAVNECRYEKPTDKLGSELADIILRVLDLSLVLGLDIEKEILNKIEANYKRGNKGRII